MGYGLSSAETAQAEQVYASVFNNPADADATIHVTGHSLGAGFSEYLLGYSISTYGKAETAARADFTGFGTPGWAQSVATAFGLQTSDFDGMFTGYIAQNDPTITNGLGSGADPIMGVEHWLAPYQPYGADPAFAALNDVSAHSPLTYVGAFGLPDWLSPSEQAQVMTTLEAREPTGMTYDPSYGAGGGVPQTIVGDGGDDTLVGGPMNDTLMPIGGVDTLTGGGGDDTFLFAQVGYSTPRAPDTITDFHSGDLIDLSQVGDSAGGLNFVGPTSVIGQDQVGYQVVGGNTFVDVNVSGGPTPDMVIELTGVHALTAVDFVLQTQQTGTGFAQSAAVSAVAHLTGDPYATALV
jgi:hypothetical protein